MTFVLLMILKKTYQTWAQALSSQIFLDVQISVFFLPCKILAGDMGPMPQVSNL